MDQRRVVGGCGVDVGEGRELGGIDHHRLSRVDRLLTSLGHDDGNGVAGESDLVRGERIVNGDLDVLGDRPHERQSSEAQVGPRVHTDDARHGFGGGRVDGPDRGVHVRRPHQGHPKHPRHRHVVHVAGLPGEEIGVLLAKDGLPDERLCGRHPTHPFTPAASSTDATMF